MARNKQRCPIKLKHGDIPDRYFDRNQLRIGTRVEFEHTNNPACAKAIAKAHLVESKNYYRELAKMEKKLEREKR